MLAYYKVDLNNDLILRGSVSPVTCPSNWSPLSSVWGVLIVLQIIKDCCGLGVAAFFESQRKTTLGYYFVCLIQ